jgi:hypothetical protein
MDISASLMHEIRMIAVHAFEAFGRSGSSPKAKVRSVPVPSVNVAQPTMKCAFCFRAGRKGDKVADAVTMASGTALCEDHV